MRKQTKREIEISDILNKKLWKIAGNGIINIYISEDGLDWVETANSFQRAGFEDYIKIYYMKKLGIKQ